MAVLTDVTGVYVRWCLAGCRDAVVTTTAVTNNANMIEIGRDKAGCRMAVVAGIAADDVRGRFARCDVAVMTGATCADDLRVIDGLLRHKGDDTMAIFTNGRRLDVCAVLARRVGAVVAARAVAHNINMIEIRRNPADCRVAIVAGFTTRNVCRRLAGRDIAVVTGLAASNNLSVVYHHRRRPKVDAVTVFANGCR